MGLHVNGKPLSNSLEREAAMITEEFWHNTSMSIARIRSLLADIVTVAGMKSKGYTKARIVADIEQAVRLVDGIGDPHRGDQRNAE